MVDGKIVKTGNLELIDYLEEQGYESFVNENQSH
jgi:Fe-S cluster assembly ATPase SufC